MARRLGLEGLLDPEATTPVVPAKHGSNLTGSKEARTAATEDQPNSTCIQGRRLNDRQASVWTNRQSPSFVYDSFTAIRVGYKVLYALH